MDTQWSQQLSNVLRYQLAQFGAVAQREGFVEISALLGALPGWTSENVRYVVRRSYKHGQPRFELRQGAMGVQVRACRRPVPQAPDVAMRARTNERWAEPAATAPRDERRARPYQSAVARQEGRRRRVATQPRPGPGRGTARRRHTDSSGSIAMARLLRIPQSHFHVVTEDYFVPLGDLLTALQEESRTWSEQRVEHVVQTSFRNEQPRFELAVREGQRLVRASYGHRLLDRQQRQRSPDLPSAREAGPLHTTDGMRVQWDSNSGSSWASDPHDSSEQDSSEAEGMLRMLALAAMESNDDEAMPFEAPQGGSPDEDVAEDAACLICIAAAKTHAIIPCGHRCLCRRCSEELRTRSRSPVCPVCRQAMVDIVQIFG